MPSQFALLFPSTVPGLADAAKKMRAVLDAHRIEGDLRHNVEMVFDEIAANIVRHSATTEDVQMTLGFSEHEIVLTFDDAGVPFDPREQPTPRVPDSLDEAQVGGLGLVLVRPILTRMTYERTSQHRNRLTLAIPVR